jgi:hypothetical protein
LPSKKVPQTLCPFILHSSKRENSSAQQIIWLICYCRKMNNPFENTNNNQNIMEQGIRPLSWPHGVITSCRTVSCFILPKSSFSYAPRFQFPGVPFQCSSGSFCKHF